MEGYNSIIAAFINSVLVLLVVQGIKNSIPILKQSVPWLIPILAGAIGPAVAAGQNALFGWLGLPIDLSAIVAIFSGASAVAINQVGKQIQKGGSEPAAPVAKPSGRISLRCILFLMLAMVFALSLSGCALLGGGGVSFDKLTPDERGRVIIGGLQDTSGVLFDAGRIYIIAQPQYAPQWKLAVVPGFDSLNKLLADLEATGVSGQEITAQIVVAKLQTRVVDIVTIFTQWGTIPAGTGGKATPDQIALLIITAIQGGSVLIDQIMSFSGGTIPTWDTIIAKNKLLQAKIEAEK